MTEHLATIRRYKLLSSEILFPYLISNDNAQTLFIPLYVRGHHQLPLGTGIQFIMMELNKNYFINIICHSVNNCATFLAVESKFTDTTPYFNTYYEKLKLFNNYGEWFSTLDYGLMDIGNVILIQTDIEKNIWSRAIVAHEFSPKYYLIDQQKFYLDDKVYAFRSCPSRFLQLTLPTYNIDINLCLEDDQIRNHIETIILKHQLGQINFKFTPKIFKNNIYSGKLFVNNKNLKSISLKKLIKSVNITQLLDEIDMDQNLKKFKFPLFNPLNFEHLIGIYNPRHLDNLDLSNINLYSNSIELCELCEKDFFSTNNSKYISFDDNLSTEGDLMNEYPINNPNTIKTTGEELDPIPMSSCQGFYSETTNENYLCEPNFKLIENIFKKPLKSSLRKQSDTNKPKITKKVSFADLLPLPSMSITETQFSCTINDNWSDNED
ncbi:Hypothetical protein CINCED_3A012138 [Cinara cedri]|uniref:Uncharacterized protein n=1 Tax=Cinara cedri TaxID=506608 RepID=A0A5E4MET4_9HEMI|nr:Hypothetical protein CINCED_3A012138 [Cinara cedri]